MKRTLEELLQQIKARRAKLLEEDYDEYQLHQLRVTTRRLRGLFRFEDNPDAWQLRREWGYLISHTNRLRDLDTLATRLEQVPEAMRPISLVDTLSSVRSREWQLTRKSLKNDGWAESQQRTRDYLEHQLGDQDKEPDATTTIHEATGRLNRAWRRAREQNDKRAWHKLRIAVKDLRYSLDAFTEDAADPRIAICKELQEELGDWHDAVIHGSLLEELDRELGRDETAAREGVARLQEDLRLEGEACLKKAHYVLTARGSQLL